MAEDLRTLQARRVREVAPEEDVQYKHPRNSSAGVAGAEEHPDMHEVDRILGERRRGGRAQFLIRWLGCAPPTPCLTHASPCVACYTCDENGARRVTQV